MDEFTYTPAQSINAKSFSGFRVEPPPPPKINEDLPRLQTFLPRELTGEGIRSSGIYQPVLSLERTMVGIGNMLINGAELLAPPAFKEDIRSAGRDARKYLSDPANQINVASPTANYIYNAVESAGTIMPFLVTLPAAGAAAGAGAVASRITSSAITGGLFSRNTYLSTVETLEDIGFINDANREDVEKIVSQHATLEGISESLSNYVSLGAGKLISSAFRGVPKEGIARAITRNVLLRKGAALGIGFGGELVEEVSIETGQAVNEKIMFQRIFENEISASKAWEEVKDDWAEIAITTFFSTALLQGILSGGRIDTSLMDRTLLKETIVRQAVADGVNPDLANIRAERMADSLHPDILSRVSLAIAEGYSSPEDLATLRGAGIPEMHHFTIPMDIRKKVISEIKETGSSQTYLQWSVAANDEKVYTNQQYIEMQKVLTQVQDASQALPDWFASAVGEDMGYNRVIDRLVSEGKTQDEAQALVKGDMEMAWNIWQAFAIVRGETAQEMHDKLIVEGVKPSQVYDRLYQVFGFHGSGAIFSQPNKAFRKTGEKTMHEGAGFYMTVKGSNNADTRAAWYADRYSKPSEIAETIASEIKAEGFQDVTANDVISLTRDLKRANEEGAAVDILREFFGSLKYSSAEKLLDLWKEDKLGAFETKALYNIRFAEGMERVETPTNLSDSSEGWIFADPNQYYLLPWQDQVPSEIVGKIIERLLSSKSLGQAKKNFGDKLPAMLQVLFEGAKGENLYRGLQSYLGSDHAVSEFLDSIGIIGTAYRGEGNNVVAYNEDRVRVEGEPELFQKEETPRQLEVYDRQTKEVVWSGTRKDIAIRVRDRRDNDYGGYRFAIREVKPELFQREGDTNRSPIKGKVTFLEDLSKGRIEFTRKADVGTIMEEFFHLIYEQLPQKRKDVIQRELGLVEGKTTTRSEWAQAQEGAANLFLKYLTEGKSPSIYLDSTFNRIAMAMMPIYKSILKQDAVNSTVRKFFDKMLATQEQILRARLMNDIPEPDWEALFAKYRLNYGDLAQDFQAQKQKYTVAEMKDLLLKSLSENFSLAIQKAVRPIFESAETYSDIKRGRLKAREMQVRENRSTALDAYKHTRAKWNSKKRSLIFPRKIIDYIDSLHSGVVPKPLKASDRQLIEAYHKDMIPSEDSAALGKVLRLLKKFSGSKVGINEVSTGDIAQLTRAMDVMIRRYETLAQRHALERTKELSGVLENLRSLLKDRLAERKARQSPKKQESLAAKKKYRDTIREEQRFRKAVYEFIKPETIILDIMRMENTLFEEAFVLTPDRGYSNALEFRDSVLPVLRVATKFVDPSQISPYLVVPGAAERFLGRDLAKLTKIRKRVPTTVLTGFQYNLDGSQKNITRNITPAEVLTIYLQWLNPDARINILEGGLLFAEADLDEQRAVRVSEGELERLFSEMSDSLKFAAQAFQKYFDLEYERISQEFFDLNGVYLTKEEYYFTKIVSHEGKGESHALKREIYDTNFMTTFNKLLESQGKFLDRMKGQRRPLIIGDAFLVVQASMESSFNYIERAKASRQMAAILEDGEFTKAIDGTELKSNQEGTRQLLREMYGDGLYASLVDFSREYSEHRSPTSATDTLLEAYRRQFVASKLGFNAWISLRQASSAALYLPETSPDIWAKASAQPFSREEMSFDPQMRERSKNYGHRDVHETNRMNALLDTFLNDRDQVRELNPSIFMAAIRRMDEYAIGVGWRIAELEGHKGQALIDRAHKLIRLTQPNYHIKDRSAVQRSTHPFARALTSFGSQKASLASMNIRTISKALEGDVSHLAKTITALGINSVLLTAVNSLRKAARKGEEWDDELAERLIQAYLQSTLGAFYGGELVVNGIAHNMGLKVFDGAGQPMVITEVSRALMSGAKLAALDEKAPEHLLKLTLTLLELRGLPAKNVQEIIEILIP
jgi:hypothetical protein